MCAPNRSICLVCFVFFLTSCEKEEAHFTAWVTVYGQFSSGTQTGVESIAASPTGSVLAIEGAELISLSNTIKAEKGAHFGFCYKIAGPFRSNKYPVLWKVSHPPMQVPNKGTSTGFNYIRALDVENGSTGYCPTYTL